MKFNQTNFYYIGKYVKGDDSEVKQITDPSIKKSEKLNLVYTLLIDGECMYVGKTVQGYSRPLNYHKNAVMKDVKNGIEKSIASGKEIEVYVRAFPEPMEFEDLKLEIFLSYEMALIGKYKPEWNNEMLPNHKQRDK